MLVACWSAKGGSGTTVVAAVLALVLARRGRPVLLADLAGDLPAALGTDHGLEGPAGLAGWASGAGATGALPAATALPCGVRVLPRGTGPWPAGEAGAQLDRHLAARLAEAASAVPVVVDCGVVGGAAAPPGPGAAVVAVATSSLLVLRPCFLALRRAVASGARPTGVVLLDEPGRGIGAAEVEAVVGAPVCARVPVTADVARAVDAGLLATRPPRALVRALEAAA